MALYTVGCALLLISSFLIVNAQKEQCKTQMDVVVVCDGSDSIAPNDFDKLKNTVAKFAEQLKIGRFDIHMGIVVYSTKVSYNLSMSWDKLEITTKARSIPHDKEGTNTHLGIQRMMQLIKNYRPGVPKVGIVLTDGRSKNLVTTTNAAREAQEKYGMTMIAVGIGHDISQRELRGIASSPNLVKNVVSFSELELSVKDLVKLVCPKPATTTTTTTTPAPFITTQTPITGACYRCKIVNGIGYNPHPESCDKFIQCYLQLDGTYKAVDRQCGYKQYWDQTYLTCRRSTEVFCLKEKCRFPGLLSYPYEGLKNCRAHWACNEGKSEGKCCREGYAYKPYFGCIADPTCKDPCPPQFFSKVVGACSTRPSEDPSTYQQYVEGFGWMKRPCARGTHFNPISCVCEMIKSYKPEKVCTPEVHLTFDDFNDHSGQNTYIHNENVTLTGNGFAYFNGNAKLIIPRFANMGKYTDFVLKMRFLPTTRGVQGLLSNGDCCNSPATMYLVKSSRNVYFRAKCDSGISSFRMQLNPGNWNDLHYVHDTYKLQGHCNNHLTQTDAVGPIQRSTAGIQVGFNKGLRNFVGYMDELKIYLCRPDYL